MPISAAANGRSITRCRAGRDGRYRRAPVPPATCRSRSRTSSAGGVPAEDGNALIELDSDLNSGNLSGGDHFNDSHHTNATIQQVDRRHRSRARPTS